jgi:hypothetical protein
MRPSRASKHAKGVIRIMQQMQRSPLAKLAGRPLHELHIGKIVARPLQKQHRDAHVKKMLCPLV